MMHWQLQVRSYYAKQEVHHTWPKVTLPRLKFMENRDAADLEGSEILSAMKEEYGEEKGKRVFYASKNKGEISGVDEAFFDFDGEIFEFDEIWVGDEASFDRDFRRKRKTTVQRDPMGREVSTYSEEERNDEVDESLVSAVAKGVVAGLSEGKKKKKPTDDSLSMYDAIELDDAAKVHITSDGYLAAMPRIARTGIQLYRGSECGRPDIDIVRVYRPADSVFAPDAIRSLAHRPVTIDHPKERVTADNWKKYAVGQTGEEPLRDGQSIRVPMVLMDAASIEAVKAGKNQLSVGYRCNLDWTPGVTEDGKPYDAVQKDIRANHLAVVAAARGGPTLQIGDDTSGKEAPMELKSIMVDGLTVQMTDNAAQVVDKTIKALTASLDAMKSEKDDDKKKNKEKCDALEARVAELTTKLATKDAETATLKQQLKDASDPTRMDAAIKEKQSVVDKAKAILGDKLKTVDGRSSEDIRREVVDSYVGDAAKGWDDKQVQVSFDTITATTNIRSADPVRHFSNAFRPTGDGSNDPRKAAYLKMVNDDATAWDRANKKLQGA